MLQLAKSLPRQTLCTRALLAKRVFSSGPPQAVFDSAVRALEASGMDLSSEQKLSLYGLFKTAHGGKPETGSRPSAFNMVGRAKWDAWDVVAQRMDQDEARLAYAKKVEDLIGPIADMEVPSSANESLPGNTRASGTGNDTFRHRSLFDIAGISDIKHAKAAKASGELSALQQRSKGYNNISVSLERESGVAFLKLDRPEKMNALSMPLWEELIDVFEQCSMDPLVRCVVLGGEGKHFCSGMDLGVFAQMAELTDAESCEGRQREQLSRIIQYFQNGCSAPELCTKPVLASIHGNAVGGAIDLLTACDLRYSTEDAFFSVKEVDLAIVADVGTMQRLPKIVGDQRARELTYTGRGFSGIEAKEIGLVLENFATLQDLEDHVANVARTIASKSSITVRGIKQVSLYSRDHPDVSESLQYVKQWNTSYLMTSDLQEAASAMMEKRAPDFDRF